MAISHKDHDHPNTPAARAACRKRMAKGQSPLDAPTERALNPMREEAGIMPVRHSQEEIEKIDRRRGAVWTVKPKVNNRGALKSTKRINSLIKNRSDMADVPRALVHGIEEAWARDLDVRVGDRFRDDEARVVIQAELGEISLVWKVTNPHGINAIFVRNWDSSRIFKVNSVAEAFTVTEDRDMWDEFGNLRTA